jgi:hypothetical protein
MRSFHDGDLVCGQDSTRTFRVMAICGWGVELRQTDKDGLHLDLRCTTHRTHLGNIRHICRACRGPHDIQVCPQIRSRLLS